MKYKSTAKTGDPNIDTAIFDLLKKINNSQGSTSAEGTPVSDVVLWDDVRAIGTVKTAGGNIPGFNVYRGNMRALEFDNSLREVWCRIQLPHRYKQGTTPRLHVHFFHGSAVDNGFVVWQAEVTAYAGANGPKPLPIIIKAAPVQIKGTQQYTEIIADFGELPFDWRNMLISGMIEYRLFRDPSEANDTSTASVFLDETDAHVLIDSDGSKQEYIK